MKRFLLRLLLILVVTGLGAAAAGGYVLWTRMHQPFMAFTGEQFVQIPQGDGSNKSAYLKLKERQAFDFAVARHEHEHRAREANRFA